MPSRPIQVQSSGALANSANWTEGLSKSLLDVSREFDNRLEREDRRENQERANKLLDAAEKRAQLDFQSKQDDKLARGDFNRFMAGYNQGDQVYTLDDYNKNIGGLLGSTRDNYLAEQEATKAYLTGDGSAESLQNAMDIATKNIELTSNTPEQKRRSLDSYRTNLQAGREDIASFDTPEERSSRLNEMLTSRYGENLQNINARIASGEDLIHSEKVAAAIRKLPPEVIERLDYATIKKAMEGKITGVKAADLISSEDKRVVDENKALALAANNKASSISSFYNKRSKSGKGGGGSGYKEAKEIAEHLGIYDTGLWHNADIDSAMKDMIIKNKHPAAVTTAIALSIDRGLFGSSFPDPKNQPKLYKNFVKLVDSLDQNYQKTSGGGVSFGGKDADFGYEPAVRKDLRELRRDRLKIRGNRNSNLGIRDQFLVKPGTTLNPITFSKPTATSTWTGKNKEELGKILSDFNYAPDYKASWTKEKQEELRKLEAEAQ